MSSRTFIPSRAALAVGGATLFLAAIVALTVASLAPAVSATVLGAGKAPPPSCPTPETDPKPEEVCQVFASVTGFQTTANGKSAVFKVPSDGHLVAWSVDLSKPDAEEQNSLINELGFGEPSARLAVLKQESKSKFTLAKQSPTVALSSYLGREPIFTLRKALRVKKGSVVALTTKNWVSNFAHDGKLTADGDKWRASRSRKKCGDNPDPSKRAMEENQADLRESKPHQKPGTARTYGCTYTAGRILYQAYYVPSK